MKLAIAHREVKPKADKGFSLVEILVVLLIIGLAIGMVSFQLSGNSAHEMRIQVKQFVNHAALISEEAVLSREQWGIDLFLDVDQAGNDYYGYRFLWRKEDKWLVAALEDMPAEAQFPSFVVPRFEIEGVEQEIEFRLPEPVEIDDKPLQPDVWLLSSGEITPFVLTLEGTEDEPMKMVVRADLLGRIELEQNEPEE